MQAQQAAFTPGEAVGGSGTRTPSNLSSLVRAKLLQPTVPANPSTQVSLEYQTGANWREEQLLLSPLPSPQSSGAGGLLQPLQEACHITGILNVLTVLCCNVGAVSVLPDQRSFSKHKRPWQYAIQNFLRGL